MGEEKLDQNAKRLRSFLFHTLGCNEKEAKIIVDIFIENYLYKSPKIDKNSMEGVEEWAEFVRTHPRSEWKPISNKLINADFERLKAERIKIKEKRFYKNLEKTEKGREILERLKRVRIERKLSI